MGTFWKIYFWAYLSLVTIAFTVVLFHWDLLEIEKENVFIDIIQGSLLVLGMAGLYGYVFSKPLGRPLFWKIIFVLSIALDFIYSTHTSVTEWKNLPGEYKTLGFKAMTVGAAMFGYGLVLPFWIALFRYGFRCRNLWSKTA